MKLKGQILAKGWLVAILLLFCLGGVAQSIRFSGFYDLNNGAGGLLSVVNLGNDTLIAVGSSLNLSTNSGYSEGHHVVVDPSGNLVYEHQFSEQQKSHKPQIVIRSAYSNSTYSSGYFCDYTVESPGPCDFYFSRLDETGDTLFTKIIERPDTSDLLLSMVETRPNRIMLIGWTYNDTTDADADILLIIVDTLGNEVNRVVYGGVGTDYIHSGIVINEDGEVLMTGYTASFAGSDNDTWLIKTDSIGNVVWHQTYNHLSPSNGDSGLDIAELQDGNFVVVGAFDNASNTESWAFAMKIDPDGNAIWTKRYENTFSQAIYACEVLDDGKIVAVGQTSNTGEGAQGQGGWLVKMDENDDTLWTRTYNPSVNSDLFRNMLVMPNGDIVMVGFGCGENSTTQDGWILRVDSMGCVVEGCYSVGMEELEEVGAFSIYPNPTSGVVRIELKGDSPSTSLRMTVTDVLGREMTTPDPSFSGGELPGIDVSAWPDGIYFVTLTDTDGNRLTQRLVVE